jgi:hypothetical protein
MELVKVNNSETFVERSAEVSSSDKFIVANTDLVSWDHLKNDCIIPVFSKDNESTISHAEFVEVVYEAGRNAFSGEQLLKPSVRVSHPIKGRIPEAMGKAVIELREEERTIYYERMAFLIDIPSIHDNIGGNKLSLSLGGVRAYNLDNLYGRKTEERFKVFIGFKNWVCTNLCVSTDGFKSEIRVRSLGELYEQVYELFVQYQAINNLRIFGELGNFALTESQFAQVIGRSRMYQFLPAKSKDNIVPFPLGDAQINSVVRNYYYHPAFKKHPEGDIDLWRLYNLFTEANKSSYIDNFLDRGVMSLGFILELLNCLKTNQKTWYVE